MSFGILFGMVMFSIIIGMWANKRGRTGFGWGVLALLISPLFAGIILAILPNLKEEQYLRDIAEEDRKKQEAIEEQEAMKITSQKFAESINSLEELHKNGILTDTEFQRKKLKEINNLKKRLIVGSKADFIANLIPLLNSKTLDSTDMFAIKEAISF